MKFTSYLRIQAVRNALILLIVLTCIFYFPTEIFYKEVNRDADGVVELIMNKGMVEGMQAYLAFVRKYAREDKSRARVNCVDYNRFYSICYNNSDEPCQSMHRRVMRSIFDHIDEIERKNSPYLRYIFAKPFKNRQLPAYPDSDMEPTDCDISC